MPRKIENPLEDGISSKVYLLTFIYGPISGYRITRMIYGHPTYTNRVYEARDRINDSFPGAIQETKRGYVVAVEKLSDIISKQINNSLAPSDDRLTRGERAKIVETLKSDSFKTFAREGAQTFIGPEEMKNVNSIQFILDSLFDISMMHINAELTLDEERDYPKLTKTRVVKKENMEKLVGLVRDMPTSLALKVISTKPLFLEYILNVSEILKSGLNTRSTSP